MQPNAVIRFTTHWPPNPMSLLIAALSRSYKFSHCFLIIDGTAYESTMPKGCRFGPVERAMRGVAYYQDMPVHIPNIEAAIKFGIRQDGAPYDYLGALGIPFLKSDDWADSSKWWCSEHTFAMAAAGGLILLDPEVTHRVTPEHLRMCNITKSPITRK